MVEHELIKHLLGSRCDEKIYWYKSVRFSIARWSILGEGLNFDRYSIFGSMSYSCGLVQRYEYPNG